MGPGGLKPALTFNMTEVASDDVHYVGLLSWLILYSAVGLRSSPIPVLGL